MAKAKSIALKKPSQDEMCPPGYHVVHGHDRRCHSGTHTWVDTHIRRNRGSIPNILLSENIHYLYWKRETKFEGIGKVGNFPENAELDPVIHFWMDYWKKQGLEFPAGFDPLLVKTMVAVESAFNPKAKSKVKGSSATGLMQLTNQTRRILSGRPDKKGYREIKSEYLEISRADAQDPITNIAAGIRWFSYKYSKIPKAAEKTLHNAIKNYHSWDEDGDSYAKQVESLYKDSKR